MKNRNEIFNETELSIIFNYIKNRPKSSYIGIFLNFAKKYSISIPYPDRLTQNKELEFKENLKIFSDETKYLILKEIAIGRLGILTEDMQAFDNYLDENYRHLRLENKEDLYEEIYKKTRYVLTNYPKSLKSYDNSWDNFISGKRSRNSLDDLRYSIEQLMKGILNSKSNWNSLIDELQKMSKEKNLMTVDFRNMLFQLLYYFNIYQNNNVKHDESIREEEVEFVFEMSSVFLPQIIKFYTSITP